MTKEVLVDFKMLIMELADDCKTTDDYRQFSKELHDCIEDAIQELCLNAGIEPPRMRGEEE